MAPDTVPAGPSPQPPPMAAPAAAPAPAPAPQPRAAERTIEKQEARQRLTTLSQQIEAVKTQEQNLETRKQKLIPVKQGLQSLRTEIQRQRGEREQDPEWDTLRKEMRELERRTNLADNPVMEAAEKSGMARVMSGFSEGMATVGAKIAEVGEVASEYVFKPLGETLHGVWSKISDTWKGLGSGAKKALAGLLRFFGKEEWAKRLEGPGMQLELQFAETMEKIKLQLRDNEELVLGETPRDQKALEAIRRNYDMLPRLLQTEKFKSLESYVYAVIRQKKPVAASTITLQEIVKASELFNADKAERDKDLAEAKQNQPTVAAAQPATTPATPPAGTPPRV